MTTQEKIERLLQSMAENRRVMAKHFHTDSKITKAQYEILWQINCGARRVVDMANTLETSTSAVTQQVQQLVEDGYVQRQTSSTDRREAVLSLTGSGQKIVEEFHNNLKAWAEGIASALSDEELSQYIDINTKIANFLKQQETK